MGRLRRAELAGYSIAAAGLVADVAFDASITAYLLLMATAVLALTLVMIGFVELGARTSPAGFRVILAIGALGVVGYAALSVAGALGLATVDASRAAEGPLALLAFSMILLGLPLAAVNGLAGAWLTALPRWVGVLAGLGWALTGIGLLLEGSSSPLTAVGGFGYALLYPLWGALIGRRFAAVRSDTARSSPIATSRF